MNSLYYTPVICDGNFPNIFVLTFKIVMFNIGNEISTFIMLQI